MNYPTFDQMVTNHLYASSQKERVSVDDLNQLLRGKRFNQPTGDQFVQVQSYDEKDLIELEEYCRKRGIVGVNFNGMSPKSALRMLKGQTEGYQSPSVSKRGLLNG